MRDETLQLIVLAVILLAYMLIGAGIFSTLELGNEKRQQEKYNSLFVNFALQNNISDVVMEKFRSAHEEACLLGVSQDNTKRWDYVGSFYFAGTVITTIGFGLTAPSTFGGQLFFLFYAIIGIPLNILFLNTALERIVTLLTVAIRSGSQHIPKNKFIKPIGAREFPGGFLLFTTILILILTTLFLCGIFSYLEDWSIFEAIYFVFVACSTVGFGDYVPSKVKTSVGHNVHKAYIVGNWFLIGFGVVVVYVVLNLLANYFKTILRYLFAKLRQILCPYVTNQIEPGEVKDDGKLEVMPARRGSHVSIASEASGLDVGSFAAIQTALDKIKKITDASSSEGVHDLKALSAIETLLRNEYTKAKSRQGNNAKARWRRAAAKARRHYRQELRKASISAMPGSCTNGYTNTENGAVINKGCAKDTLRVPKSYDNPVIYLSTVDSQNNEIFHTESSRTSIRTSKVVRTGDLEVTDF